MRTSPLATDHSRALRSEDHAGRLALLRDLDVDPRGVERNRVAHAESELVGNVDVATGKVALSHRDFALGTDSPFVFSRVWSSASTYLGPLGHGWHHAYDLALACRAQSVAVRMANGRVVRFAAADRAEWTEHVRERLRIARDAYGYVLRDSFGAELRFVSHRSARAHVLGALRTSAGVELRFGYDHRARLTHIGRRGGIDLELSYDRTDRLVAIGGPDAHRAGKRIVLAQYAYDSRGNLRKASDALGQAKRYAYERNLLSSAIDRNGTSLCLAWDGPDARARCVRSWVAEGVADRRFEYREGQTTVTSSLGHETTYVHDGAVVTQVSSAAGVTRVSERDAARRVVREIDALGHVLERSYDAQGNLRSTRAPDGAIWSFAPDAAARALRALDAIDGRWQFDYDARGRLVRLTDPRGETTRLHHSGRWLVGITEPSDRHTRYTYDASGNLTSRTGPDGAVLSYAYDAWGQVVSTADSRGITQRRQYDVLGRLIAILEPDGNTCELAYDAEGNLVCFRDLCREIKFTYQGTGQLSSRSEAGQTVCFEYDSEEQLVGIVNEAADVLRIRRTQAGEIAELTGFDGCQRSYARDAAGRVVRAARVDAFSEYDYDAAGRVVEVQHSDGAFEGYRYRADGALMSAWNQQTALVFARDALGRVVREEQADHAITLHCEASGERSRLSSSLGAQQLVECDVRAGRYRVAELAHGFEVQFELDERGFTLERSLPGGGRCAWQRDALGRPCVIRLEQSKGALRELSYEWAAGGRLLRRTDSQRGTTEYRYDARGELAWLRAGSGRYEVRMLDAVGNPFAREDRRDREYGAAGQLHVRSGPAGEVESTFDAAGNLVSRCGPDGRRWTYAWNAAGRLRSVRRPEGTEVTFGYDPFGRRIWKKYLGQTTRFVWDGARLLHEWVEGELLLTAAGGQRVPGDAALHAMLDAAPGLRGTREAPVTWLYAIDGLPIARLAAGSLRAVWVDHAGVLTLLLDEQGREVWSAEASMTGDLLNLEGERHLCLLRGPRMYEDLETGLYCAGAEGRYYDAVAGTFICQGPLAEAPSLRAYAPTYDSGVTWGESLDVQIDAAARLRARRPDREIAAAGHVSLCPAEAHPSPRAPVLRPSCYDASYSPVSAPARRDAWLPTPAVHPLPRWAR